MLEVTELRLLTGWCRRRGLRWQPFEAAAETARLLLEPLAALHPWQRMVLVADAEGLRLEDEACEPLAAASDLPALLDALDGGVADRGPDRATDRATGRGPERMTPFRERAADAVYA